MLRLVITSPPLSEIPRNLPFRVTISLQNESGALPKDFQGSYLECRVLNDQMKPLEGQPIIGVDSYVSRKSKKKTGNQRDNNSKANNTTDSNHGKKRIGNDADAAPVLPKNHKKLISSTASILLAVNSHGLCDVNLLFLPTCTKQHYGGSKAHTLECYHKILKPLYLQFLGVELTNSPKILSVTTRSIRVLDGSTEPASTSLPKSASDHANDAGSSDAIGASNGIVRNIPNDLQLRQFEFAQRTLITYERFGVMAGFGHVIWDAAYLMVKFLEGKKKSNWLSGKRIIELGSGVGLVGLCVSLLGGNVTLTDMPSAISLTQLNVEENLRVVLNAGGSATVEPLEWGNKEHIQKLKTPYQICLASDVVYDNELFLPLIETIHKVSDSKTEIYLSARERHGCDFDKFIECAGLYFDVQIVSLDNELATMAQNTAISKEKKIPNIYKFIPKKQ